MFQALSSRWGHIFQSVIVSKTAEQKQKKSLGVLSGEGTRGAPAADSLWIPAHQHSHSADPVRMGLNGDVYDDENVSE